MNSLNLDTNYRWDNSGNNFGWIESETDGPPESCADDLLGYTFSQKTPPYQSIITICELAFGDGKTLTEQSTTTYTLNQKSMNNIVEPSLTGTLIHELSHAWSIMGGLQYVTSMYI